MWVLDSLVVLLPAEVDRRRRLSRVLLTCLGSLIKIASGDGERWATTTGVPVISDPRRPASHTTYHVACACHHRLRRLIRLRPGRGESRKTIVPATAPIGIASRLKMARARRDDLPSRVRDQSEVADRERDSSPKRIRLLPSRCRGPEPLKNAPTTSRALPDNRDEQDAQERPSREPGTRAS